MLWWLQHWQHMPGGDLGLRENTRSPSREREAAFEKKKKKRKKKEGQTFNNDFMIIGP